MPLTTPLIQLLDRDPVSIDIRQPVSDAVRVLTAGRFHHLPVLADGKLVGMLSTTDVLVLGASMPGNDEQQKRGIMDRHYSLADVMQKDVIRLSHRATVGDAARQLSAGGFHSLPVVDHADELVGIITTTDLIAHMLDAPPQSELPDQLRRRLKSLEQVRKAAQAFLHSGMAAIEHQKLERALAAAEKDARSPA